MTIERAANSTLANPIIGGADQTCPRCWGHLRGELIQPRLWVYAVPVLCQAHQSSHLSDSIYSLYLIPNFPKKLTLCRLYCLTGKRLRPTFIIQALLAYQAYLAEIKSAQRNAAAAASGKHYY